MEQIEECLNCKTYFDCNARCEYHHLKKLNWKIFYKNKHEVFDCVGILLGFSEKDIVKINEINNDFCFVSF